MSEPRSLALPADLAGLVPFTYAYRYAHNDSFVIRFSHGQEINGGRPVEAIPLYTAEQLQSATADAITALSARVAELEAELATAARAMEADPDSCISLIGRLHKQIDAAEAQASLARRMALEECRKMLVFQLEHFRSEKPGPTGNETADSILDAVMAALETYNDALLECLAGASPTLDMDAMVERGAEALFEAYRTDECHPGAIPLKWAELTDALKRLPRVQARAVLSALLEGGE